MEAKSWIVRAKRSAEGGWHQLTQGARDGKGAGRFSGFEICFFVCLKREEIRAGSCAVRNDPEWKADDGGGRGASKRATVGLSDFQDDNWWERRGCGPDVI